MSHKSREEFGSLNTMSLPTKTAPDTIEEETDATLAIIALRFGPGSKWLFGWNGIRIPMSVKDDALIKEIDKGAMFGKGDAIRVKMRITKVWNAEYNFYENKSYKIVEFYEHIIPSRQTKITTTL
ncbi:MAG: hypothetical protein IJV22_06220 [Bacteroidales bacterium]|nr:hypothetical protein [Bacteroidales bacterium]